MNSTNMKLSRLSPDSQWNKGNSEERGFAGFVFFRS